MARSPTCCNSVTSNRVVRHLKSRGLTCFGRLIENNLHLVNSMVEGELAVHPRPRSRFIRRGGGKGEGFAARNKGCRGIVVPLEEAFAP